MIPENGLCPADIFVRRPPVNVIVFKRILKVGFDVLTAMVM
jgi:hypothetical protein